MAPIAAMQSPTSRWARASGTRPCIASQSCVVRPAWERRRAAHAWLPRHHPDPLAPCVHQAAIRHQCSRRRPVRPVAAAATNGATADSSVGIVIVDHGSRKKASNEMLVEFVEVYKYVTGASVVEVAHMEIAEPTIDQAVGKCVAQGVKKVVVAPYFLSRGRHIQEDIPALVKEARAKYNIDCVIADPIGVDPLMAKLIQSRVEAALQESQVPA